MDKMKKFRKSLRLGGSKTPSTKKVTRRKSLRKSLPKLFSLRNKRTKRDSEISESEAIKAVEITELQTEADEADGLYHVCIQKTVLTNPQNAFDQFVQYIWKDNAGLGYFTSAIFMEKRDQVLVGVDPQHQDVIKQGSVKKTALFKEEVVNSVPGKLIEYEVSEGPFPAEFFKGKVVFDAVKDEQSGAENPNETVISWNIRFKPLNFNLISMAFGKSNAESVGINMMRLMINTIFPVLLFRLGRRISTQNPANTPKTVDTDVNNSIEAKEDKLVEKVEENASEGEDDINPLDLLEDEDPTKEKKLQWAARRMTGYEGNLTPQQIKAFEELKLRLQNSDNELAKDILNHVDGDRWLLRFLRAECSKKKRNFNVDISEKRLFATAKFRRELGADTILDNKPAKYDTMFLTLSPELILVDNEHRPIVFTRAGAVANDVDFKSLTDDEWKHMLTYNCEYRLNMCRQASKKLGYEVSATVAVYDIEGIGRHSLRIMPLVRLINSVSAEHYPEFVDQIVVLNAPRMFGIIWNMVKVILDPVTKEKVQIFTKSKGDKEKLENMFRKLVPIDDLPKEFGGNSDVVAPYPVAYLEKHKLL